MLSHSPMITTDGLVLCLDAANPRSYAPGDVSIYWYDLSGNNHDAVAGSRGAQPTADAGARGGFNFDGTDDYMSCGSITLTGSITVIAWIKINSGAVYQHVVDSSSNSWHLAISSQNRPYLYVGTWSNSAAQLSYNTWYMIAGTYASPNLKYYINDSLSYSMTATNSLTTNTVNIGRWQSGGRYFNGSINNTMIYNRALTADEVRRNYLATKSRFNL